jgi:peptidyl-prolyl cis-trans isomerase C
MKFQVHWMHVVALSAVMGACTLFSNKLATFTGGGITADDFKKALEQLGPQGDRIKKDEAIKEKFLDHLVNQKLIEAKAKTDKFDKSKEFQKKMAAIKREVLSQTYVENYIEKNTTDAKAKEYFTKNKSEFSDEQVRASHILFKKDEKKAKEVLAEALKKGADFAALAKKHSEGPTSKKGGDLNFFGRGAMVPAFEKVAFAGKKGVIHPELVKSQFGWHIIKVTDKKGGGDVKFTDAIKSKVQNKLRRELSSSFIENLRKDAKVVIKKDALKKLKI